MVNSGQQEIPLQFQLRGKEAGSVDYYVTSSEKDLEAVKLNDSERLIAPKRSVTTIVLNK